MLLVAAVLSGCASFSPSAQTQVRIREKSEAYQNLTPKEQGDILGGAIQRGNTKDAVYLALGKPKQVVTAADGKKAMWVYVEHYSAGPMIDSGFNNPNASHYTPSLAGATSPPTLGGPSYAAPMGMGTTNPPFAQSLVPSEMRTKTVYVFFYEGKVVEIKLDGDATGQMSTALNRIMPPKPVSKFAFPRSAYGGFDE